VEFLGQQGETTYAGAKDLFKYAGFSYLRYLKPDRAAISQKHTQRGLVQATYRYLLSPLNANYSTVAEELEILSLGECVFGSTLPSSVFSYGYFFTRTIRSSAVTMQRNMRIVETANPGTYSGAELAGQIYAPYTDDRLAKALVQMSVSYQDRERMVGKEHTSQTQ
jgi:hypothetical protein